MRFTIIYGSVRENRQGIKAARFITTKLKERKHDVELIDAKEHPFPLLDRMYKEFNDPPQYMREIAETIERSDGIVVVTGEYNHSVPPALKNLLDHYQKEYLYKPSAIVSYSAGGFGGVRSAVQMRAITGELGMPSIPSIFAVSKVQDSFDESGNDLTGDYDRRIGKFLDELEWYAKAMKYGRDHF